MLDFFRNLFSSDFMPHGHCFYWQPGIVWLHVSSDALIAVSYFLIPIGLVQLVRKRRDLEFTWMYLLFGIFILSCGLTHTMNIWDIWHSTYRLEGLVKAITAVSSLVTALLLFRLIPVALTIPSPAQLRVEVEERRKAEQHALQLNLELEERVEQRTATLARTNAALQRFAYIASHDLQEPIRTVRSMNQMLARECAGKLGAKADSYIKFVVEASGRMQSLVSDLMVYARVLDGSMPRQMKMVDPEAVLHSVLHDLQAAIDETGAAVTHTRLPRVFADEMQLKQVFLNLITNAIKYSRKGVPPVVEVSAERRGPEDVFAVRDNGIGIDAQYHEQIFVAFRRLHGREYEGSGVGLTICRDLLAEQGGRIWIESEVGRGSTFFFSIPTTNAVPVTAAVAQNEPLRA